MPIWTARTLPIDRFGSSTLRPEKSALWIGTTKQEPEVTGLVGIREELYDKPRAGKLLKITRFWRSYSDVKIIGVYGVFYSYSDGKERISEGGKHYIVILPKKNEEAVMEAPIKIHASRITFS